MPQNILSSFTWSENKKMLYLLQTPQIKDINMQFYSKNGPGKDCFKPNGSNVWFYLYIFFYYPISFNLLRDRETEGHRELFILPFANTYGLWSYIVSKVIVPPPPSKQPH